MYRWSLIYRSESGIDLIRSKGTYSKRLFCKVRRLWQSRFTHNFISLKCTTDFTTILTIDYFDETSDPISSFRLRFMTEVFLREHIQEIISKNQTQICTAKVHETNYHCQARPQHKIPPGAKSKFKYQIKMAILNLNISIWWFSWYRYYHFY